MPDRLGEHQYSGGLDAAALTEAGILSVIVDGADVELEMPYTYVARWTGKLRASRPLNQFRAPFCLYPVTRMAIRRAQHILHHIGR